MIQLNAQQQDRFDALFPELKELSLQQRRARLGEIAAEDGDLATVLECALVEPPTLRSLVPGDLVGDCTLTERLSAGSYGEVWKARQQLAGGATRLVAVKFIHPHLLLDDPAQAQHYLQLFHQEIDALAQFQHPHIVRILQTPDLPSGFGDLKVPCVVMQYHESHPLHPTPYLADRAAQLGCFLKVCDAVHYCHNHGRVHLDLKPDNIRVQPTGEPIVIDFGISERLRPEQPAMSWRIGIGTLPYMAPEQLDGKHPIGKATDVHALGVLLFQMLTDRLPYDLRESTEEEFRRLICGANRLSLLACRADEDPELAAILAKAMSRDPANRFAHAGELRDTLAAWQQASEPARHHAAALAAYRKCVFEDANKLRLETIHSAGASRRRDLASVYVALDTQTPKPKPEAARDEVHRFGEREKPEYVSALEAVINNRLVVLLGAPGSGKSTFVQFLSLCMAGEALQPGQGWCQRLPDWPEKEACLLPFTIELRRFAKESPRSLTGTAVAAHLWDYLAKELRDTQGDNMVSAARSALESGRAIILLDGLDEIAEPPPVAGEDPAEGRRKQFVHDVILAFARPPLDSCRIILTCRTRSYVGQPWALGWPEFVLADFDRDKIAQFAEFWFSGAGGRSSVARTEFEIAAQKNHLISAIDERPHLLEVAGIPLLLTLMAFVHQHEGELPRSQAKLYEKIVELLVFHWHDEGTASGSTGLGLRPLLGQLVSENAFLGALQQVALEVQRNDQVRGIRKEPSDISGERLRDVLAGLRRPRSLDWANNVIAALQLRAGLLRFISGTPEKPVFAFLHRSFQEYFAGTNLALMKDFAKEALSLLQNDLSYWQNTVKWAAGRLAHKDGRFGDVRDLVRELCLPFEANPTPAVAPLVLLAGEILADAGPFDIANTTEGQRCVESVQTHLQTLMFDLARDVRAREEAGKVLGAVGDPRFGVGLDDEGWPKMDWIPLPAGKFTLGETRTKVEVEAFKLSRYPVTWKQFQAFVDNPDGYQQERFWNWLPKANAWWKEHKNQGPENYGPVFQTTNHPRVGVCWYEAAAFCRWLTERLREQNQLPKEKKIRLPHEAEWEWAARCVQTKDDKTGTLIKAEAHNFSFPWRSNDENDLASRCNCERTGIGHTSAVGLFPDGKADCGALDMSGNVWEWCENWYDEKTKQSHVLRGGSFDDGRDYLRCAYRINDDPVLRDYGIGFRVVVAGGSASKVSRSLPFSL